MIVWGGLNGVGTNDAGGRYDPSSNTWTPTTRTNGAPEPTSAATAVWTGTHVIVWGGSNDLHGSGVDTGGRYDPVLDLWQPTSTVGAPAPRYEHTAVWTGTHMIVWGGGTPSGGLYDPLTDAWIPTTQFRAPTGTTGHTAVWTGTEMIIWGGKPLPVRGARYSPQWDAWTPMSNWDSPESRFDHAAVWTGSAMIVWGGMSDVHIPWAIFDTGGVYDPAADTWTATDTAGAPTARSSHTAVWTGARMIVWGGRESPDSTATSTGGAFDPVVNGWTQITLEGAPAARNRPEAVWTGTHMIIWDGSGALYEAATDSWTAVSIDGAPAGRTAHATVWAGDIMMVYGGSPCAQLRCSGGRLHVGSECAGR